MSKRANLYDEHSIVTESPREFTRRVPSTYLGSSKKNTNLVKEIFANAADEHSIGNCDYIKVSVDTDKNIYIVEDNGQGFLVNAGIDEDGETILQRSFDKLNTSGKTTADGVYQGTALGLNGIGAKLTNWLSKSLNVITYRDGEFEELDFVDGIFKKRKVGKIKHASGTIVTWKPDPQFFGENVPDEAALKSHFEIIAALCPNLTIEFTMNGTTTVYAEPGGINTYVERKVKGKELFSNRFIMERAIGKDKLNICITYTSDYSENIDAYVNLGHTDSGQHIQAFHTAFVKAVNKYATDAGLLKKNDKNFNSNEIAEGLYVVFNMTTTTAKYDAQNKSRIDDIDAKIINAVVGGDFATWLLNNPADAKIIVERALQARKAREAAQKAKEKIRDASKKVKSIFVDLPSKLSDAYPKNKKDRSNCELYICEGDSAGSSINATKDSTFQACFPIRGKILCCQKATPDKVFGNAEIANITKALGLEVDKTTGKLIYDPKKLRYARIIMATDEDADGYDIALLLLTVFNWLCPELIENGHIYRVHGALFKVTFNDGTYITFQTDAEFENWKKTNKKSYKLSRAKGLGELTKEETYEQLINPETRDLVRLVASDMDEFNKYLEIFKGVDVAPRREYLEEHFNDYDE
ncbi:MAG: hypothetical protein IJZ79_02405 [Bacilli bacterium]|nr:hypothetical protein [Bacilli bacterium]